MSSTPPTYHTFLVTLWQERGRGEAKWHFTLEDATTGERQGFVTWEALMVVLNGRVAQLSTTQEDEASATASKNKVQGT